MNLFSSGAPESSNKYQNPEYKNMYYEFQADFTLRRNMFVFEFGNLKIQIFWWTETEELWSEFILC